MRALPPLLNQFCLALAICSFGQNPALASPKTEWLLVQHHQEAGNDRIYITDDAVRLENTDRGFEILAKAPDWRVEIFRADEKLVYRSDLKSFDEFSIWGRIASRPSINDLYGTKKETVSDGPLIKTRYHLGNGEVWLADNVARAPQIKRVLTVYNRSPKTGVPIYFRMVFAENSSGVKAHGKPQPEIYLTTKSATIIPYKASDFTYPSGYTEVKAYGQLLSKKPKKADMEMIMNGFGFSEPALKQNRGEDK